MQEFVGAVDGVTEVVTNMVFWSRRSTLRGIEVG